jgi:hypothetical protein
LKDLADFGSESANDPDAMARAPWVKDKKERNKNTAFDEVKVLIRQANKCCIGIDVLIIRISPWIFYYKKEPTLSKDPSAIAF